MKTILVGVDGSESSLHAVRGATELAKPFEARLVLLYASSPLLFPPTALSPSTVREIQESEAKSVEDAVRPAMDEARAKGVSIELAVLHNVPPAEAVADAAERYQAWLVAVGTRGRHGVSRVLLGSVADRVVHICKRPVVVFR